jgi:hypothetical protein
MLTSETLNGQDEEISDDGSKAVAWNNPGTQPLTRRIVNDCPYRKTD